jgi:ATP-binding cassette, subfamily B, bacterial
MFKYFRQFDAVDCGPTCLKMVAKHYGKDVSIDYLREKTYVTREGASLFTLRTAAENIGFKTFAAELSIKNLSESPLPCILYWNENHFVVLYKIKRKRRLFKEVEVTYCLADPADGIVEIDYVTLQKCWARKGDERGFALFLAPTEKFFEDDASPAKIQRFNPLRFVFKYLTQFKSYFIYVLLVMLVGSLFSLSLPFITQSIVDIGIANLDISFITLMLLCQVMLFIGSTVTGIIQSHLLLHVSTRINISVVSDFLSKLMKLPIKFFETKMIGDIMQRIQDHAKIDQFLTGSFLDVFLSLTNLIVFSVVLAIYDLKILGIFLGGSVLAIVWTFLFNEKRRSIDYRNFQLISINSEKQYELVNGMQEIKLNNFEDFTRWDWENSQVSIFKLKIKNLSVQQAQDLGSNFITQLKNIIITFFAAYGVITGDLTLGMMLSVSYIIGQLNVPVERLKAFFISFQSLKFSLERMSEVHQRDDEEKAGLITLPASSFEVSQSSFGGIVFEDLSFQYEGPASSYALKDVSVSIPLNKVTAIVGTSGSGKTTLLKLLLKFYDEYKGSILINNVDISRISSYWWRSQCGSVMQEGYLFSDTIKRNICMADDEEADENRILEAARIANIYDFIVDLPLGFNTKIGKSGNGISAGQKQRILIARAVYKNAPFLFFDEATSALDANNERVIIDNLNKFFKNRTVVIIAHRLSTVKNADQLIVLEKGQVVEVGNHQELVKNKGHYFELVKNQLELGN